MVMTQACLRDGTALSQLNYKDQGKYVETINEAFLTISSLSPSYKSYFCKIFETAHYVKIVHISTNRYYMLKFFYNLELQHQISKCHFI